MFCLGRLVFSRLVAETDDAREIKIRGTEGETERVVEIDRAGQGK